MRTQLPEWSLLCLILEASLEKMTSIRFTILYNLTQAKETILALSKKLQKIQAQMDNKKTAAEKEEWQGIQNPMLDS